MTAPDDILIVDDTPQELNCLADILTENGYRVQRAGGGKPALESVTAAPPSLILLEIRMADMDGFEVCRRLKANELTRHIPVLFISGKAAIKEKVKGFALGAVDFISKPFQQEELLARVRTQLELHRLRTDLQARVDSRTEELRQSETKLRSLFAAMSDVIFVLDAGGRYLEIAPTRADSLYQPLPAWLGRTLHDILPVSQANLIHDAVGRALEFQRTIPFDYSHSIDKNEFWFSATASPLSSDTVIVVSRDITERKRIEDSLWEMSFRDQLTGLYNRRGFINLAEQQIKAASRARKQMPLVFIDVDNMKWINDTLGHEAGDQALIDTAAIFQQSFRESDIVARIGGDEFAVLAIDVTEMNPAILSDRLQQNIDAYNAKGARCYNISMSWGIAVYNPESPVSLHGLMAAADELMYAKKRSKAGGR